MILIENFFKIIDTVQKENQTNFEISLNKEHEIYKGHFPDKPIVPGVMQIQIIKDLLSLLLKGNLQLQSASNIKYLALMDPEKLSNYKVVSLNYGNH